MSNNKNNYIPDIKSFMKKTGYDMDLFDILNEQIPNNNFSELSISNKAKFPHSNSASHPKTISSSKIVKKESCSMHTPPISNENPHIEKIFLQPFDINGKI